MKGRWALKTSSGSYPVPGFESLGGSSIDERYSESRAKNLTSDFKGL